MAINVNQRHSESLTSLDKAALYATGKVGTPGFFFFCFILVTTPVFIPATLPYIQYVSSGYLQLLLLPLIMIGQNLLSRHSEIRAEVEFETSTKSEKQIEEILHKLETQGVDIVRILKELESRK